MFSSQVFLEAARSRPPARRCAAAAAADRRRSMASTAVGDCENGEGTMAWADGDEYAGQWCKGEQHGRGIRLARAVALLDTC